METKRESRCHGLRPRGSRRFSEILIHLLVQLIMLSTELIESTSMVRRNPSKYYDLKQELARVHPILLIYDPNREPALIPYNSNGSERILTRIEQNKKTRKKKSNNEFDAKRAAGRETSAATTTITRTDASTQVNQVRSQNQMQTRVKRETENDNQFQSSALVVADEHEQSGAQEHAHAGRPPRAAPTSQQQQPFVQAIAGQRLVIPCRNLSSSGSAQQAELANQQAGGQVQSAAINQRRPAGHSGGPPVLVSSRFKPAAQATAAAAQTGAGGIALIVWHKDEQLNAPIFAADARGAATLRDAKQHASSDALRGRARLDLVALGERGAPAPALVIDEVSLQDAGLYTCVVEFLRAPTQTFKTRVSVIEPPKNMLIREEAPGGGGGGGGGGENYPELQPRTYSTPGGLVGPYDEDSRVTLVCEAEPGKPASGQVSWWRLDSVTQLGAGGPPVQGNYNARKTSNGQLPVTPLDEATHLTTLSIQEDPTPTGHLWSDNQATPTSGPRDLFLGPHSLQLAPASAGLAVDGPAQPVAGQLAAISHLMSGLNLTGNSRTAARLRHWRRIDNKTTGSDSSRDTPTSLTARLELPALGRSMLGAEFLCLAANDLYSLPPLNTSVTLNMNLNPTEVRLVNRSPPPSAGQAKSNQSTFALGQKTMVECQVVGSKPSPSIKWFRGAQEIEIVPAAKQVAAGGEKAPGIASEFNRDIGNLTKISYLTFVPQLSDNQQALTCSASNARIHAGAGRALADSLVMNVQHEPRLTLSLGASIRPDSIKLASDVFMDCQVEANPPIQELVWLHRGRPLAANISAGVILSKQSLVLRNLALNQRGAYQCQARNLLGRASSDKLELRPLFEPQCDQTLTRSRHEVALNQPTRIECHVLAEPAEGLHFTWRFNRSSSSSSAAAAAAASSGELGPAPDGTSNLLDGGGDDGTGSGGADSALTQYETNFTRSSVIFTPRSRRHFGTLLCSATNSMGRQARPCAIQLVQSELPEPVLLCFDDNIRPRSFSIHCTPPATTSGSSLASSSAGSGAGPNKYVLEVYAGPAREGQDDAPPSSPGGTHLRLRDQPARSSDADLTSADYLAGGGDSQSDQEEPGREQVRIKRLLSESPTFEVADLRPNSSYNVLVYVQNSKGRSPAFHHQVSTQPEAGDVQAAASTHHNGGLESVGPGGRAARMGDNTAAGPGSKLLAYLKLDDYFGGPRGRGAAGASPLVGVALVVLLASVTLVTLVFFAKRLICGGRRAVRTRREQHEGGCKVSKTAAGSDDGDDDASHPGQQMQRGGKRRARPLAADSNEWRAQAAGGRSKSAGREQTSGGGGGAGSGSDTSRETNTESTTLVSSPKPAASADELASNELDTARHQQAAGSNYNCEYARGSGLGGLVVVAAPSQSSHGAASASNRRCSHNDLTTLAVEHLTCPVQGRAATLMRRPRAQQISYDPGAHYQAVAGAHQLRSQAASCTPQMSVHSSECTSTSNNLDVNSLDLMRAGGFPPPDGGVYVIQEGAAASASDFWCDQLAMSMAGDPRDHAHQGGRCQLIGNGGDSPCQLRGQQLPSSFSIPVSLSDRLTLIAARPGASLQDPLGLSQDNLALQAAAAGYPVSSPAGNNSPYITLAGGHAPAPMTPTLYGDYCASYRPSEQQMPSPPVNFGATTAQGWHRQTDLDSPAAHASNCATLSRAPKHHRVKFDTSSSDFNELDATSGPSSLDTQHQPTRL